MRVVYLSLSCLALASPAALAQNAASGFDPASAIQGFLTDEALLGASSATIGSLSQDGDTVTVDNVQMRWSATIAAQDESVTVNVTADIPSLSVRGLAATDNGHSVEALQIPSANVSIEVEGAPEKIGYELTVTNYVMEGAEWLPFPVIEADPDKPVSRFGPLVDWAVSQSYERSGVDKVSGSFEADGEKQEFSYGPAFFGPVESGRLASLEYGPFSVKQSGEMPTAEGDTKPIEISIDYGKVSAKDVDLNPVAQFLTGNGSATGLTPIMSSMTMDGFSIGAETEFTMSMGSLEADDLGIDPTRGPLLAKLDPIVAAGLAGTPPSPPELISLMLDMYGAYGIGRYEMSDMSVTGLDFSASVATMITQGLNSSGLERFAIEGVSVDGEQGKGALESFEIRNITFPEREAFMGFVMNQLIGVPFTPADLAAIPTLGGISVKGLQSESPMSPTVQVDLFDLSLSGFVNAIPTSIAVTLEGLQLPLALVEQPMAQMVLGAVGADPVKADLSLTLGFDEGTGTFSLDNDTAVGNVGALTAEASLSGIPAVVLQNPMRANEAIATATINGIEIRFDDQGITPFVVGMMAEQAGISAAEFAQGMAQQVQLQIAMMTGDTALAEQLANTVSAYLTDPQSLLISARPANPVPIAQIIGAAMAAPQQIPQLLNLTISANQ